MNIEQAIYEVHLASRVERILEIGKPDKHNDTFRLADAKQGLFICRMTKDEMLQLADDIRYLAVNYGVA